MQNVDFTERSNEYIHTYAEQLGIADDAFETLCQNMRDGKVHINSADDAMVAYNGTLKKVQVQQKLTSAGAKLMSGAMKVLSTVGWMVAITLVTEAISAIVRQVDEWIVTLEEAREKTEEEIKELESLTSEVENLESKLSDLNKQISELDPITNDAQIQKLKEERDEGEQEVALLK